MNKYILLPALAIVLLTTLYSCRCSCTCTLGAECTIIMVNDTAGNTLQTKMFCSGLQYSEEQIRRDSADAFIQRHTSANTHVTSRDSMYIADRELDVKCKNTNGYESRGYNCECAK